MKNRSLWTVLLAVAAMALALTACGDDDDSNDAAPADDSAQDAAEDSSDGGATDEDPTDEDPTDEDPVDASDLDFDLGECGFLANFGNEGFEEAFDPSALMTGGGDAYGALADQFHKVADAAPDDIQDAFETMAEGMDQFAEAFEGIDFSDPSSMDPEALESLEAIGDGPGEEFEKASAEIETWINQNCAGIG